MARLDKATWDKAKAQWQADESLSYETLAKQLGVSKSAVIAYAKRNGWSRDGIVNVTGHIKTLPDTLPATLPDTLPKKTPRTPQPKTSVVRVAEPAVNAGSEGASLPQKQHHSSLYRPEYANRARDYCLLGATNEWLGRFFDVSEQTIITWCKTHPEFGEAVREGRDHADAQVAQSLYQRAIGYTWRGEKIFNNNGEIVRADVVEHVPPDVNAARLWLFNRQPKLWREKMEVQVDVSVETSEERDARRERFARAIENAAINKERVFERCRQLDHGVTIDHESGHVIESDE